MVVYLMVFASGFICAAFIGTLFGILLLTMRSLLAPQPGEPGVSRHPHQILFPFALWLFHARARPWLFYPVLLSASLLVLWLALIQSGAEMWLATLLVWSVYFPPLSTHIGHNANSDLLTTLLAAAMVFTRAPGWLFLLCLLALLAHQRTMVLVPAVSLWTGTVLPFALAVIVFVVFKYCYYALCPLGEDQRDLSIREQWRRLIRSPAAIDPMNRIRWRFGYALPLLAWLAYDPKLATALVIAGTFAQLLVAEDGHRLTGFLFLGYLMQSL